MRPVATSLLMVAIVLAGLLGYQLLPQSALPEVDYPTIQVTTAHPGASPEIVATTVTAPLERQFGAMARPRSDVLCELGWRLGDQPALQPGGQPRYRRADGAGCDRRGFELPAR